MRTIKLQGFKNYDLFIESAEMPNEWILTLIVRYENMIHDVTQARRAPEARAYGCYLIKTEESSIVFENEDSSWTYNIEASINKVWYHSDSPSIKLQSIVNLIILQEIHKNSVGKDLKISWRVSGFGFMYERDPLNKNKLIRIEASSIRSKTYSRRKFLTDILEKVDRFKREFIEITIPTKDSIIGISDEFKPLANLLMERFVYLEESLKKMYDATTSREYTESIGDVRKTLENIDNQISQIKGKMAEKLFLELGTFTGPGARDQSEASIAHIRRILTGITNLASGMGIHLGTKEKKPKPYIPHPDYNDARYILLTSILTLDYLSQKLQNYNIRQAPAHA